MTPEDPHAPSNSSLSKDELWAMVKARRTPNQPPLAPEPPPALVETAVQRAAREEMERLATRSRARAQQAAAATQASEEATAALEARRRAMTAAAAAARARAEAEAAEAAALEAEAALLAQPPQAPEPEITQIADDPQEPVATVRPKPAPFQRAAFKPGPEPLSQLPSTAEDDPALEEESIAEAAEEEVPLAQLSQDTAEVEKPADNTSQLRAAQRTALVSSVMSLLGVMLLLGVIRIAMPEPIAAEIVAFAEAAEQDQAESVMKKVAQDMPSAAPMATSIMPITASGVSEIAVPRVDTKFTGSDLNIGTTLGTFGTSLSNGTAGGTISFLGNRSVGRRVVFVVDVSSSMSAGGEINGTRMTRFELLKKELTKSINGLANGTQYQIIFFSDYAWAHDAVPPGDVEARLKLEWFITSDTVAEAKIPRPRYRTASLGTIRSSREIIAKADNPGGTNWGSGLFTALKMSPTPDVIFFMTDGSAADEGGWVAAVTDANTRAGGKTIINTTAMMEPDGAVPLSDMAINNGGSFTVVLPNGKVVKGEDWFKGVR
jgi:hypothetical protein